MNRREVLTSSLALAVQLALAGCVSPPRAGGPPAARREPVRIVQLGRTRIDPYAWLRDPNYQEVLQEPDRLRPDIRAHLEAENRYSMRVLGPTRELQRKLIGEMHGRIDANATSVGQPDGAWVYFTRYRNGGEQPHFLRRPRGGGTEQLLFDAEAAARGKQFFHLRQTSHSPDHRLFACSVDEAGSEYYRILVIVLATGEVLGDPPANAHGTFVFSPDAQWLFWVGRDENGRPSKLFRRPVRGGRKDDVVLYVEPDERLSLSLSVSRDRFCVFIKASNQQTSETWFIPAAQPTSDLRPIRERRDGVLYTVDRWRSGFIMLTNEDGAIDNKVMAAERGDGHSGAFRWRQLIGHVPGRYIVRVVPFAGYLVWLERKDAQERILIRDGRDASEAVVRFDEEAFALSLEPGFEYATTTLRLVYQSPVTPRQWWDYNMATEARALVHQEHVPGYDPSKYVVRRLHATAPDGERIPITTTMRSERALDGSAPVLLFGYGAYGLSIESEFSSANVCLLDRGWICATAHIRGGSEKGWGWFLDGRAFRKKNTFTDYIAAAEHLCATGYTRPRRILAYGRSAGGMLAGAVLNMRPDLWAGVLAGVPFVDVLNTMSDVTLPLTPPEWPEWGNPLTNPRAYDYIASYSPYDNVRPHAYPPVLATCGLTDPRVTYWEPAKWIARLRANNTGRAPIMLRVDMTAGHLGADGRYGALEDAALNLAFTLWAMDWTDGHPGRAAS